MATNNNNPSGFALIGLGATALLVLGVCGFGGIHGVKVFNRYQAVEEATNKAKVARINAENEGLVNKLYIERNTQRVEMAKQDAIRKAIEASGIAESQKIINGSLTPEYLQYQYTEMMQEVGASGKGNTIYFAPEQIKALVGVK